jgi:UPF0755 protein
MFSMKHRFIAIVLLVLIFIVWWQPIHFGTVEVTIAEGAHAQEIADYLAQNSVVRDVDEFLFWLKLSGKGKSLKSGTYNLSRYSNPVSIINNLTKGGRSDITVTIPEGLTVHETAEILKNHGLIGTEEFMRLCTDERFIRSLGLHSSSLEGYLFPDTYAFSSAQNDSAIIMTFVSNTYKRMKKFNAAPDSLHKIITIASLVEKEARIAEERPIIARVFMNRLATRRPLESCATILYALRQHNYEKYKDTQRLLERDLIFDSPYNTYIHYGLPPGPICSPGAQSIEAVLNPADVDYLYFVSMGDGRHHFSRTFREHVAAKERYSGTR